MHVENSEAAGPPPTIVSSIIPPYVPPTPMSWRLAIAAAIVVTGTIAYVLRETRDLETAIDRHVQQELD